MDDSIASPSTLKSEESSASYTTDVTNTISTESRSSFSTDTISQNMNVVNSFSPNSNIPHEHTAGSDIPQSSVIKLFETSTLLYATSQPLATPSASSTLSTLLQIGLIPLDLLSYSLTVRLNFWSLLLIVSTTTTLVWLVFRYRILTRYSRLPTPPRILEGNVPFDLHPQAGILAEEIKQTQGYPDDFMRAFLSSIKVFGYLDRPVFHELARHLQTKKLKQGQILFDVDDDDRNFYVVVDGVVQTFVKENQTDSVSENMNSVDLDVDREKVWPGYRLLNEVKSGGTVSSLFSILSVFTDDLQLPQAPIFSNLSTKKSRDFNSEQVQSPSEEAETHELNAEPQIIRNHSLEKLAVFPELVRSSSSNSLAPDQTQSPPNIPTSASRAKNRTNIVARAGTDTTLAVIPSAAFHKLTEKFPNAVAHIVQVILTRFQRVTFLTLHRYLGLSRELLKIEKLVNEFAEYSIPSDLISSSILDRLRSYHTNSNDEETITDNETRSEYTKNTVKLSKTRSIGKQTSPRVNEKEGNSLELPPVYPMEKAQTDLLIRIPPTKPKTSKEQKKSIFADLTKEEYRQLKFDVFNCISGVIGMSDSPRLTPKVSSPIGSPRSSTSSTFKETNLLHLGSDVRIFFFKRGSKIVTEGERVKGLYFVLDGLLEVSMLSSKELPSAPFSVGSSFSFSKSDGFAGNDSNGKRSLFLIKPGGLAGYLSALTGHPSSVSISAKTDSIVGFLPKATLENYVEKYPNILLCLAKRLIMHLPPLIFQIDIALDWDQLTAGQILCHQNDPADAIYIVLNGRLRSITDQKNGTIRSSPKVLKGENFIKRNNSSGAFSRFDSQTNDEKDGNFFPPTFSETLEILGEYGQGESVGELEVLMDMARPGTLYAIRDTEVTIMPKTLFNALAYHYPHIAIQLSRIVVSRHSKNLKNLPTSVPQNLINFSSPINQKVSLVNTTSLSNIKTVAILPVSNIVPVSEFATKLLEALRSVGERVSFLDMESVLTKLGKHAFTRLGRLKLLSWLAEQEETYRLVLYVADGGVSSPWTQRCIRQADCILLVGLGDGDPINSSKGTGSFTCPTPMHTWFNCGMVEKSYLDSESPPCIRGYFASSQGLLLTLLAGLGLASQFQRYYLDARRSGLFRTEFFNQVSRIATDLTEFSPITAATQAVTGRPYLLSARSSRTRTGRNQLLKHRYQAVVNNYVETDDDDGNSENNFRDSSVEPEGSKLAKIESFDDFPDNSDDEFVGSDDDENDDETRNIYWNRAGSPTEERVDDNKFYTRNTSPPARASALTRRRTRVNSNTVSSDFSRLARRLLSRSVGLVLGGGGARGVAHVGVIRAFEEAGIPVDIVGGTSIGSFVGGLYAKNNDYVSVLGRSKQFAGRMSSLWRKILDITYPVTSMFTGHEFNRGIWKCFFDTQIEDCWIPYFCVTTNITWSRMEIHQSGYIWRYIRASMSLSGYLPPLCDNGNMLLDGGYLNNLPADVMKHRLGADTVIAVDVGNVDDTSPVNYGDSLSGWWVILNRWFNPWSSVNNIPQLADIQSRLAYVSSVQQLEDAKNTPGVLYIRPPVSKFGTLEFSAHDEIEKIGYNYAVEIIKSWEKEGILRERFGLVRRGVEATRGRTTRRASI
ncbi:phosphatidylcholine and lysophosphatidylcholine phospholipase [Nowakowskiella sp. JEL0407]|nr:phosphatidylcholine and lysophosphatidylcholine phospholipase [Nowakowskiella sp. JEL0407]